MSDIAVPGLLDRAIRRITTVWRDMAAGVEDESIAAQMRACLAGRGGEVSARNRAAKLAETYQGLDEAGRKEFLRTLASFDSDADAVATAYAEVQAAGDPAELAIAKAALRRALEPPRLRLLTQFTTIPDGRKFLVDLRGFLLKVRRDDKLLAALEADLRGLLAAWFDIGFLELQRIDWNSPAALLEKLVGYEAVHEIRSWRDMKNRLDSDRRCYAFFHPRMPGEPLIFVEVALVKGLAGSVQGLLDEKAPLLDPRRGGHRDLLLDQQLPARTGGHQLRQFPDQARGRGVVGRVPQPEDVCHPVADPGFSRLAGREACRGSAGSAVG